MTGKFPVWSVYTWPEFLMVSKIIPFGLLLYYFFGSSSGWSYYFGIYILDLAFFLVCVRWPLIVAYELRKYLFTFIVARTDHPWKNPRHTSTSHVDTTRLKAATCRYAIRFKILVFWCTLLHWNCAFDVLFFVWFPTLLVSGTCNKPVLKHPFPTRISAP